jgi:hypothetical protein
VDKFQNVDLKVDNCQLMSLHPDPGIGHFSVRYQIQASLAVHSLNCGSDAATKTHCSRNSYCSGNW